MSGDLMMRDDRPARAGRQVTITHKRTGMLFFQLMTGGNAYMDREFPLLDRIRRVTVVRQVTR